MPPTRPIDPEHDAHEIGSDAGGEVLRSRRRDPLPLPGDLLAHQGQTPHPSGRSRHRELGERPRPDHDGLAVLDHGHDAHGDRRHDDHEHRHGHHGDREAALAPESRLDGSQRGPGGDDDHGGPDGGEQKGPQHPEARRDQATDCQHGEQDPREIPGRRRRGSRLRAHSCHPPPSALYSRTTASSSSRWLRTSPSSASKSWRSESRTSRYVVTPPV